jgi:hypothetical protein
MEWGAPAGSSASGGQVQPSSSAQCSGTLAFSCEGFLQVRHAATAHWGGGGLFCFRENRPAPPAPGGGGGVFFCSENAPQTEDEAAEGDNKRG